MQKRNKKKGGRQRVLQIKPSSPRREKNNNIQLSRRTGRLGRTKGNGVEVQSETQLPIVKTIASAQKPRGGLKGTRDK